MGPLYPFSLVEALECLIFALMLLLLWSVLSLNVFLTTPHFSFCIDLIPDIVNRITDYCQDGYGSNLIVEFRKSIWEPIFDQVNQNLIFADPRWLGRRFWKVLLLRLRLIMAIFCIVNRLIRYSPTTSLSSGWEGEEGRRRIESREPLLRGHVCLFLM